MLGVLARVGNGGRRRLRRIDRHERTEHHCHRKRGRSSPVRHYILRDKSERSLTSAGTKNGLAKGEPASIRPSARLTSGGDGANARGGGATGANGDDDATPSVPR